MSKINVMNCHHLSCRRSCDVPSYDWTAMIKALVYLPCILRYETMSSNLEADCLGVIHSYATACVTTMIRSTSDAFHWKLIRSKVACISCRRCAMSFWKLIALVYLLQEVCDVFLEADCLGVSLAGGVRCLFGS